MSKGGAGRSCGGGNCPVGKVNWLWYGCDEECPEGPAAWGLKAMLAELCPRLVSKTAVVDAGL